MIIIVAIVMKDITYWRGVMPGAMKPETKLNPICESLTFSGKGSFSSAGIL